MTVVAGLVLAAGEGRRYGMPKALVRHRGRLFVQSAAEVLMAGGCAPVVVVTGAAPLTGIDLGGAILVHNPLWATGMGSSLRAGLDAVADTGADAVLVLPVDLPDMTAEAVRRVSALAAPGALAAAEYDGERGHPVLIGRDRWAGVHALATGDSGARNYLRTRQVQVVPCADVAGGRDVDRPTDLPR